jgi:hypothetical protein
MRSPTRSRDIALFSAALLLAALTSTLASAASPSQTARILAGMQVEDEARSAVAASGLGAYTSTVDGWWDTFEERLGGRLAAWALDHIEQTDETVFYPFAGADFPTVHRLYPNARRYVLMALEPAGRMPDLTASRSDTDRILDVFRTMMEEFHRRGYFITSELGEQFSRGLTPLEGITPVLAMTAEREGFEVRSIEPVRVADDGSELVPHGGDRDDSRTWRSGVRLELVRRSDGATVLLDYLRLNLSNDNLQSNEAEAAFVTQMTQHPVLVKAASYLLQYGSFSFLRDAILANSPSVVQDDSGIDYTFLSRHFEVQLYGRYERPHFEFSQGLQSSLVRAYAAGGARPLPSFRFGYWKDGLWCLQYARRAGATAEVEVGSANEGALHDGNGE